MNPLRTPSFWGSSSGASSPSERSSRAARQVKRPLVAIVGASLVTLSVASCSQGIYAIPLPGGADLGDNPMRLTIQFEDVLDLVPQSTVKVDGVEVGRVDSISVADNEWTANVGVIINDSVDLPANAIAGIEQTNILGEKFVQLTVPAGDADPEKLTDGDTIPLARTSATTNIEQVLGALSLLLNGGGVGQLAPIVKELNAAFDGREGTTRQLLEEANTLITGLEQQREDITRALDGLDVLTTQVSAQTDKIDRVLQDLPIATEVLEQQRPQLTAMLGQLDRLGAVGTDVINQSRDDLIADLRALRPTLQALAASGDDLVATGSDAAVPGWRRKGHSGQLREPVPFARSVDRNRVAQLRCGRGRSGLHPAEVRAPYSVGRSGEPLLQRQRATPGVADHFAAAPPADHSGPDACARRPCGPWDGAGQ